MLKRLYARLVYFFMRPVIEHHHRVTVKARHNEISEAVMHSAMNDGPVAHGIRESLSKLMAQEGDLKWLLDDLQRNVNDVESWAHEIASRLGLTLHSIGGEAFVVGESAVDARSPEELLSAALKKGDAHSVIALLRERLAPNNDVKAAKD